MSSPALPFIECEQIHAGLAVSDIATAVEFYVKKLGFQPGFLWGIRQHLRA
jgi:catechol 2,3-dioxygenase-like lactoylglutathione lyase family enzyme